MRQHKAVARIILFLSIVKFTFAGVAQTPTVQEVCVDLVTGAEERGHTQSELPEWLGRPSTAGHLHSRFDIISSQSFNHGSTVPDDPEKAKFFNKELNRRMKEYFVLGAISGVFVGLAQGIQKQISGTVSPGAYVFLYISSLPVLPTLEWRGFTNLF